MYPVLDKGGEKILSVLNLACVLIVLVIYIIKEDQQLLDLKMPYTHKIQKDCRNWKSTNSRLETWQHHLLPASLRESFKASALQFPSIIGAIVCTVTDFNLLALLI